MAEVDYQRRQLLAGTPRSTSRLLAERGAVLLGVAVLYGFILVALSLDSARHFIVFVSVVGVAVPLLGQWRLVQVLRGFGRTALRRHQPLVSFAVLGGAVAVPLVFSGNPYLIHVGTITGVFALMALGLNFALGLAGLLDLGYAAYFAAGAYASALLGTTVGLSFWMTLPLAGIAASVFGLVAAWPSLRVNDRYLALVTLGFGAIVELLARNVRPVTGGTDGVLNIPPPTLGVYSFLDPILVGPLTIPFQASFFYLVLVLLAVAVLATGRLTNSRTGRAWEAIREDQIAASCFGVSLLKLKLMAFMTGSFFAGLAGAVFAHMIGFIHPDNFTFSVSLGVLCMVIAGGAGNVWGVLAGAVFYIVVPERLREFDHLRLLLFGVSLLLLMRFRPQGVFPSLRRRVELAPERPGLVAERERVLGLADFARDGDRATRELAETTAVVEIVGLTKSFGGLLALNDVGVRVARGEILGIIGPNGSGKTTLFNVITGLYRPDCGDIWYGTPRKSLVGRAPHEIAARGVARTFQTLRLFANLTVLENVLVAMTVRLKRGYWPALLRTRGFVREEEQAVEQALEVLSFFGQRLLSMCNEPAASLSYANRRRLEIARVLASEAELVLLDEPAAGMNPAETAELMHDIERIHRLGRTILLIEHDMSLIQGVARRVIALDHGSKIAEGRFEDVAENPLVIEAYLGRRGGARALPR